LKGYKPRINLVKDENDDLFADSHNILNIWKNYFCQILYVHEVSDVRQVEMHTAEPLISELCPFKVDVAIEKLKGINHQILIKLEQKLSKK
jgi:hypothetical protein